MQPCLSLAPSGKRDQSARYVRGRAFPPWAWRGPLPLPSEAAPHTHVLGKTGRQRLSWQTVQKFQRLWEGGVSFTCGRNLRGTFWERPLSFLVVFTRACRNGMAGRWGTPSISLASVGVTLRPWLWLSVS